MNYDTSISSEVSLSKILDEMLIDGTDIDIVVSFLRSHERQIEDIYRHSAFVYDLYDLAAHPYQVNEFLLSHIEDLPCTDAPFAVVGMLNFLNHEDYMESIRRTLRNIIKSDGSYIQFRSRGWKGFEDDALVASGELNLVDWVSRICKDPRDAKYFLQTSVMARSALMANTFLQFSPNDQYVLLHSIAEVLVNLYYRDSGTMTIIAHATRSLLKQLLMLGEVQMFNWAVDVLRIGGEQRNKMVRDAMMQAMLDPIPRSLWSRFAKDLDSFELVVFEMNMMETQFDVLDLFMYVYLLDDELFKGMDENTELLEFFNLPFKWEQLKYISNPRKVESEEE